jgi:SAM-dependent methyltransferase
LDCYSGVDNLEVMKAARNYLRFLNDSIAAVAGPPSAGRSLVDFGAGAGTHALDLRARGYDVSCVEIDAVLRERLLSDGLDARSSLDAFAPRRFDVAYTMNVLEHVDDDLAVLQGLRDQLVPAGRLLVYVPALEVLYSAMDRKVGHVRRYHRRALVDVVRRAGFVIDRSAYVDSLGFFTTLLYKAVGSRNGDIGAPSVAAYDRFIFPASRRADRVLDRWFGKNLLLVAHRPA